MVSSLSFLSIKGIPDHKTLDCFNTEPVSLMRLFNIEKMNFGTETSGVNCDGGRKFEWCK